MNRRYFLGLALSTAATPVFARKTFDKPRVLSFYHLHTEDRIDVTYRIGDRYQRSALQRLNYFFRDFRTGDTIAMDPRLLDLLYDLKITLGDPDARYHVLSAYRSPATNNMLRRSSSGVAKKSLHLKGQAIDIRFPDLSTRHLRDTAIELSRGGVGYYPRSNFVHLDTGAVRQWRA
ncbi:YcbK family protein [Thiorhodococcus fuscus]|uniref:Murein endopeptidase K n=1 Tax=Thiorhodococcus fuscus TaxID=527200 RepID=A0ABW4Y343_9GAMM